MNAVKSLPSNRKLCFVFAIGTVVGFALGWPACAQAAIPDPYRVIDGDTLEVQGTKYRIVGFDTPETYRPKCDSEAKLGQEATRFVRRLLKHPSATFIKLPGVDYYGRNLADIVIFSMPLSAILSQIGLAHKYEKGDKRSWC